MATGEEIFNNLMNTHNKKLFQEAQIREGIQVPLSDSRYSSERTLRIINRAIFNKANAVHVSIAQHVL